jgi:hypothetical protein
MPDISSLSLYHDDNGFSLKTKKHGIVDFSNFSGWRTTLIFKNVNNIQDIEPSTFCLIVAKYLISKKDNLVYDEYLYKSIKSYDDIELTLETDELNNFSKEFISKNISVINNYVLKDKLDNNEIIKIFFIKIKEEFDKIVENTTRFTKLLYDNKLLDQIKEISEVAKTAFANIPLKEINRASEAVKAFSGISSKEMDRIKDAVNTVSGISLKEINKTSEAIKASFGIPFIERDDEEIREKIPPPIISHNFELEILCDIKELFSSFITMYNSFKEYSKGMFEVTNTTINKIRDNLEAQIKENERNTKLANQQSNRAFCLSIAAVCISLIVGILQIFISINPNKQIDRLHLSIEQLSENIFELNKSNDNYIEKIEFLTNELINQNEIRNKENNKIEDNAKP